MFPGEFDINFALNGDDMERLVNDCEALSIEILGPPNVNVPRDERKLRLQNGTSIKIARTVINFAEGLQGFSLDIDIFSAEESIEPDDPDDCIEAFSGTNMYLFVDLITREITRQLGGGILEIDHFGVDELTYESIFDTMDEDEHSELTELFSPSSLEASDQLALYDARQLLRDNILQPAPKE